MPRTSFTMRFATRPRKSMSKWKKSAVMPSTEVTARSAHTARSAPIPCSCGLVPLSFWLKRLRTEHGMAKQPKGGTSRIRFIMLDAEIPEGDLSQLTSAIQNALKPTTIVQQRPPNQLAAPTLTADGVPSNRIDQEPSGLDDGASAAREVLREPRESRARKPSVPKVLDLDLTSGLSFES